MLPVGNLQHIKLSEDLKGTDEKTDKIPKTLINGKSDWVEWPGAVKGVTFRWPESQES